MVLCKAFILITVQLLWRALLRDPRVKPKACSHELYHVLWLKILVAIINIFFVDHVAALKST